MTKVKISSFETSWNCDDCGTIFDKHLIIEKDGEEIFNEIEDGHFGNGVDLSDTPNILKCVLKALGYDVEVQSHDE